MRARTVIARVAAAACASACACACGDARWLGDPDASSAPGDAAVAPDAPALPDADLVPDGGSAPDASAPPSRLTFRRLLGEVAIANRLLDPQLEPTNFHWLVPNTVGWDTFTRLSRLFHPDAPSGGPVLRVRADRERPSALVTDGRAAGRPLDARIWVGHHLDQGDALPEVALSGTDARGLDVAVTLVPRDAAVVAAESNVEWVLHEGRWSDAPIGEILLTVLDAEPGLELFVTGAELVDVPLERRLAPTVLARPRPLAPRDHLARDAVRRAARDRRTPPVPLPRPNVGESLRSRRLR